MAEQFSDIGGAIRLCYETFGSETDPPMLLIMGLGMQMLGWPEDFCEQLAGRGFYVVRFDNRDIGRSTRIHGRPPTAGQLLRRKIDAGAVRPRRHGGRRGRPALEARVWRRRTWSARRWAA